MVMRLIPRRCHTQQGNRATSEKLRDFARAVVCAAVPACWIASTSEPGLVLDGRGARFSAGPSSRFRPALGVAGTTAASVLGYPLKWRQVRLRWLGSQCRGIAGLIRLALQHETSLDQTAARTQVRRSARPGRGHSLGLGSRSSWTT
jgi:hypothetical protein